MKPTPEILIGIVLLLVVALIGGCIARNGAGRVLFYAFFSMIGLPFVWFVLIGICYVALNLLGGMVGAITQSATWFDHDTSVMRASQLVAWLSLTSWFLLHSARERERPQHITGGQLAGRVYPLAKRPYR